MGMTRRGLLGAGLAVSVLGWPRRARADVPRVLLVGDSMIAGGVGIYLQRRLKKQAGFETLRHGKSSTGLARPDFYDWVGIGAQLREEFQPDATVVMFGGNDGQGLYMGRGSNPKWIRYTDEAWTAEYRRRVNAFADAIAPNGQQIFWIGMPVMKPTKLHARVRHMNTIYRAEMAIRKNATFLDIWRVLAGEAGEYVDKLDIGGKKVRVRAHDGVHISGGGATVIVDHVAPTIESKLREPVAVDHEHNGYLGPHSPP
jgi:hypothetical protein